MMFKKKSQTKVQAQAPPEPLGQLNNEDYEKECGKNHDHGCNDQKAGAQNKTATTQKFMYESEVAVGLFRDMELALIGEADRLEKLLQNITEMKGIIHCSPSKSTEPVSDDPESIHDNATLDCVHHTDSEKPGHQNHQNRDEEIEKKDITNPSSDPEPCDEDPKGCTDKCPESIADIDSRKESDSKKSNENPIQSINVTAAAAALISTATFLTTTRST